MPYTNLDSATGFKYVFVPRTKNLVPPLFFMTHESFAIDCYVESQLQNMYINNQTIRGI